jgi:hypothetical protein
MTYKPFALTSEEIKELAAHRGVQQMWGAENSEEMELALKQSYAVKFQFMSGGPGYIGDLFIIHGDCLDATMPAVRLFRNHEDSLEILH